MSSTLISIPDTKIGSLNSEKLNSLNPNNFKVKVSFFLILNSGIIVSIHYYCFITLFSNIYFI
jgi:hypothetical protein